jgi:hypothetical protein
MTLKKRGRNVVAVEFAWEEKSDLVDTKGELGRHSAGRRARREGAVEQVTSEPPAAVLGPFPADGSIYYGWGKLVRRHIPDTPDVDLVANAFRRRLKETGQRLDAGNVEEHFVNFCKKWAESGRKN